MSGVVAVVVGYLTVGGVLGASTRSEQWRAGLILFWPLLFSLGALFMLGEVVTHRLGGPAR